MLHAESEVSVMGNDGDSGEMVSGDALTEMLADRFRELLEGAPEGKPVWTISGGKESALYGSIEGISAEQASREVNGTTLAAHVEHVRWALQLVNDYFDGVAARPAWSESWQVSGVDEAAWNELRSGLRATGDTLLANILSRQRWNDDMAMNGALASLAHTAYHLGAVRQLLKAVA